MPQIAVLSEKFLLPVRELPDAAPFQATYDEAAAQLQAATTEEERARARRQQRMAEETLIVIERGSEPIAAEVQVMRIGDVALVALPGEPFVELGLEIKQRSAAPHTFVVGYANDWVGYLPTQEAWQQGGYEVVELSATPSSKARILPKEMGPQEIKALQAKLASYGLTPISVSGHSDLARAEGVNFFKTRIDFAAALGVGIINTGTGHTSSPSEEESFFTLMREEVIPFAQARGVKIALETHGGLTGTAQDCLQTLEKLDSDQVGINYDPANVIYYRGVRPEQDLPLIAGQVIHVHLKDQHGGKGLLQFPILGEGEIDFAQLRETLAAVGYQRPYSAELELEGPLTPAAEDAARVRTLAYMEKLLN